MSKKNVYVVQFGTGANINLLPIAAGQLVSRLKQEKEFLINHEIKEIIFRRDPPEEIASRMEDVLVVSFSCYLWNLNHSLAVAKEIKKRFPDCLIAFGGPAAPKDREIIDGFLKLNDFIDVIGIYEGEEIFVELCKKFSEDKDFKDIPGIIYKNKENGKIIINELRDEIDLDTLSSPYIDGTFDELYDKYSSEFSGAVLETNRGCPYGCAYCTWGNQSKKMRTKPLEIIKKEIDWIGKKKIKYIAMADSNFGLMKQDLDFTRYLSEIKNKYGFPNFISVSWAKNSSENILQIAKILRENNIGFRITLSLQSLNQDSLDSVRRVNLNEDDREKIKEMHKSENLYSYTELILGLPLETYESFTQGLEKCLSESVFDQLYLYVLYLYPNTDLNNIENREKYGLESIKTRCSYTKSKDSPEKIPELVEVVIGTSSMPREKWVDSFVIGNYALALHDTRLGFFILNYLKKEFGIKIIDLIEFSRKISKEYDLPIIKDSFDRLERKAKNVQNKGEAHLIKPFLYGSIPFDPPEGIFLELLLNKKRFFIEFMFIIEDYLRKKFIFFDKEILDDLFRFQENVIAGLNKPDEELELKYNWIDYFLFCFNQNSKPLKKENSKFKIMEKYSCEGNPKKFIENYFEVRGVPPFNILFKDNQKVFPPVKTEIIEKESNKFFGMDNGLKLLIDKYNKKRPFYTSYPTESQWNSNPSEEDYIRALKELGLKNEPLSLYLHFPFCPNQCHYCFCRSTITRDPLKIKKFLNYISKEIKKLKQVFDEVSYKPKFKEIHIGGGSPTLMNEEEFSELLENLKLIVDFDELEEFTLEIDPRDIDKQRLKFYQEKGVNRASFGVQEFNPEIQKAINRIQPFELIKELLSPEIRKRFKSVNFDLIYGLPLQTSESFKETLNKVIEISPDRICLYNYGHNPEIYKPQKLIKESELPDIYEKIKIFIEAKNKLMNEGYVSVGIDHFAKPNDDLAKALKNNTLGRNFNGYHPGKTNKLLGVGPSGSGRFDEYYFQNVFSYLNYYNLLDSGIFPLSKYYVLNGDDLIRRKVIDNLTCNKIVYFKDVENQFNINFKEYFEDELKDLREFVDDEIIELKKDSIKLTPIGELFVIHVCTVFNRFLKNF